MDKNLKKRLARTAVFFLIALCVGVAIGFFQISQSDWTATSRSVIKPMAGSAIGGGFSLIDHNGASVTEKTYAGQYKLLYFGFTYCPAICPTELQKITQALNKLGEKADVIQPLFITIDPERDTPAVIKEYVSLFHSRLEGLSGSVEQVKTVMKNYGIYANKVADKNSPDDYTMDHSSYIYFMSPDNKLISIYHMKDDAEFVAKDIAARL